LDKLREEEEREYIRTHQFRFRDPDSIPDEFIDIETVAPEGFDETLIGVADLKDLNVEDEVRKKQK
jgi:hypothetical protein